MARRPEVFVRALSMEEGRKLQRVTRTAKDPVKMRRAISPRLATSTRRIMAFPYIRKTPKPSAPSTGPLWIADRQMPSTVRVSLGSMTPSS